MALGKGVLVWTKNNSSLLANFAYARLSWGSNNLLEKGIWRDMTLWRELL
jgi:hypothetical protein